MKLHLKLYSLGLALISLAACKDNSSFTISGQLQNFGKAKKVVLLEADSASYNVVDSAQIGSDGKFEFKHHAPFADLYKLRTGGGIFDIIAKNGDHIDFKTDLADSAHAYTISGSEESAKIQEFNKVNNAYGAKNAQLYAEFEQKAQSGANQEELMKTYTPLFWANMKEGNHAVLKFINDNKQYLAAFYASTALDPQQYESDLIKYAEDIKGQFKDNPAVKKFIAQMMAAKPLSIGHAAPEFTTNTIDGKPVKLSDYKGKYLLIDFWASWCAPCRQENPNVVKMYRQYHDKGLNILGISLDTKKEEWQKAISDDKLTWKHASDLKRFEGPTETLYHIEAIPSNFLIGPNGVIIAKNITGPDLEEILKKTFTKP